MEGVFFDHRTRPYRGHQFVLGDQCPRCPGQHLDQIERPAAQRHDRAIGP